MKPGRQKSVDPLKNQEDTYCKKLASKEENEAKGTEGPNIGAFDGNTRFRLDSQCNEKPLTIFESMRRKSLCLFPVWPYCGDSTCASREDASKILFYLVKCIVFQTSWAMPSSALHYFNNFYSQKRLLQEKR